MEVASASDTIESLFEKVRGYLEAGTHTVLVALQQPFAEIHVFERSGARRLLRAGEVLDLGAVLPGFRPRVEEIFER